MVSKNTHNMAILKHWFTSYFLSFFTSSLLLFVGFNVQTVEGFDPLKTLNFPEDVVVEVFSDQVPSARHIAFDDQGVMFLTQSREGRVTALPDKNRDQKPDQLIPIMENRRMPHGLAFAEMNSGYYLFVAEEHQVVRMKRIAKPFKYGPPETFVGNIPVGNHSTRTIKIHESNLYLSVGSSCNICEEKNSLRATITKFHLKGGRGEVFARGLRNTVGIEFSPYTGELWGVNNGSDRMGDDFPREELNLIQQGKHYGWPYCHNYRKPDPKFGRKMDCAETENPIRTFTAHMAPLGLAFYQKGSLPSRYNHSIFIAFHGSWNRSIPAGYKIVRVILTDHGEIQEQEDFITGFLGPNGNKIGRPVDVEESPEGDLYISDDYAGRVYRVRGRGYSKKEQKKNEY